MRKEKAHVSTRSPAPLAERAYRRLRRVAGRWRRGVLRRLSRPSKHVYPDIVEERTNIGPAMDALVMEAKRRQEPLGLDRNYDLVRDNFDHVNFMLGSQAVHQLPVDDPIRLFLRQGADAMSSPNYNFSMVDYLERYPHRRDGSEPTPYLAWLKGGRSAGEIADPAQGIEDMAHVLGLEPARIVEEVVATRSDMMERLRHGELGRMFAQAADVEPLIGAVWGDVARTRLLPVGGKYVVGQAAAIHACQSQAGFRRARLVVVTDRPRFGAGRAFVSDLARGLMGPLEPDDIVVIYTDEGGRPMYEPRLPTGVRELDFATVSKDLPEEHKHQALASLLRSFRADAIVNVGSRVCYRLLAPYGKALAASERIFLVFISNEQRPAGHWDGWSLRWFYAGVGLVAGFITDSEYLRDQLTDMYQLSDADRARIHVFRSPTDPELEPAPAPVQGAPSRRPVVHWVGARDRQSRMDTALEIARRMPDVDFQFWSVGPLRGHPPELPANVRLERLPGPVAELELADADAWLHTWAWGGLPTLLLDVAMTEVPIVAGLVGGAGEVFSDEDAWLVTDWQNPEAYQKALREILTDRAAARARSRALRERLRRDRTVEAYREYAAAVLLDATASAEELA
jgi:glycosyltransferase involved in cell wall biosynthesis